MVRPFGKVKPMTRHEMCSRSPGSSGIRHGESPGEKPGAPGLVAIPLTQRKAQRILDRRDSEQTYWGESAGTARFGPCRASLQAVSPAHIGRRSIMPRSRGELRSLACNLTTGRPARQTCRRQRSACAGARRQPVVVRARARAGRPDHQSRLDGRHRLLRHDHPRHRGRPAARRRCRSTRPSSTPTRATLRVFDVSALGGPPSGQLVYTPQPFEVLAGQIGQVFGLTYDDGVRDGTPSGVPNLYAGATSLHGIRIVTPDADADGRPERERRGKAGATFMEGQFAEENGGSPGRDLEDRRPDRRGHACSPPSRATAVPASATSASTRRTASSSPPTSTPA